ncbi:hypothetical protein D9M70_396420 [compost metagenome]
MAAARHDARLDARCQEGLVELARQREVVGQHHQRFVAQRAQRDGAPARPLRLARPDRPDRVPAELPGLQREAAVAGQHRGTDLQFAAGDQLLDHLPAVLVQRQLQVGIALPEGADRRRKKQVDHRRDADRQLPAAQR